MPVELEMPELAESVIEGEIVKWLVKEGDHVAMDQLIVEVMTDKVTVEVPSPYEGILLKQVAKEGDVVAIGKPIAIFGKEGETLEGREGAAEQPIEKITPEKVVVAEEKQPAQKQPPNGHAVTAEPKPAVPAASAEEATLSAFGRPMAAPAVRKLARELGVDLNHVKGSGDGGRIRSEDVKRVAESGGTAAPVAQKPVAQARPLQQDERIPLRGLRRVIADHMIHSKHTAAHTLHVDEADLTELVALRASAKEKAAERGVKLTYLPFFVRAVCYALKKYPFMNASLDDAAHEIILKKDYNIGIAANTEAGLVVPVVHHADEKTIFELAAEIGALADKARAGKLAHEDITGGTFTITNVGSVGGLFTFPVINYPEVGILGTHGIQERPVVRNGQIVIRHMMYLSISFDHRVVDGAIAAHFVKEVADYLASPALMLMEGS
jgi:2-oxoisovalerate dehydrogenase E2 component (dihydrolipoyl transacylase)